ncbi:MAG: amidase [Dehalococcoidia bacterium]
MTQDELVFTPAWQLRDLIRSRQLSPVELTEQLLRRIEALNPRLNAYLTVCAEEALAAAREAEAAVVRGGELGPLHGLPISIKDMELTRGIRTTIGSLVYQDLVPQEDSVVAERVRRSGAIILGKTNTPEFGMSGTTENRLGDACRNPWDPERTSGGSSGGAGAALAAGLCSLATGSDGGGSIRIPSSLCGLYGIKPTQGRVPRAGGVGKPAFSSYAQAGPMARTVRDAALLLQVLAGPDRRDPVCLWEEPPDFVAAAAQPARGLRLAWSPDLGYAAVEPEVTRIASEAALVFQQLGCTVEEVPLSFEHPYPYFLAIYASSGYAAEGHLLEEDRDRLTNYVVRVLEHGRSVQGWEFSRSLRFFDEFRARMRELLERYDLLLTPTLATTAFPVGQPPRTINGREVDWWAGFFPFTFPFNMTGQPAASIPCGFTSAGLPVGLQIIGRLKEEETVLRASATFEEARPWQATRPPVG